MDTDFSDDIERKLLPWGFWATIGFSFLVIVVHMVVGIAFVVVANIHRPDIDLDSLGSNGLFLAITTIVSMPLVILVSLLFAKLRKRLSIKEYFCLYSPGKHQYIKWILGLLVFSLCSDGLSVLLGKPIIPEFMVHVYRTALFTPLLWLALIIAAPLSEEVIFRGFLFKGIENSRIGGTGAILISSLGWAALHVQYDLYGIATVFVGGLLLGIARLKSQSIYVPIIMHMVWSLIAIIQTAIYVKMVLT